MTNEQKADRLRVIAFHIGILTETLQEKGEITTSGVQSSQEMAQDLIQIARELSPEPSTAETTTKLYSEHLARLRELRLGYGDDYEGKFLDNEIAGIEAQLEGLRGH